VLVLHRFPHNTSTGADEYNQNGRMQKYCGTQGRLRGALAIPESQSTLTEKGLRLHVEL